MLLDLTTNRTIAYRRAKHYATTSQEPVTVWIRRDISTGLVLDYCLTRGSDLPISELAGPSIKISQLGVVS